MIARSADFFQMNNTGTCFPLDPSAHLWPLGALLVPTRLSTAHSGLPILLLRAPSGTLSCCANIGPGSGMDRVHMDQWRGQGASALHLLFSAILLCPNLLPSDCRRPPPSQVIAHIHRVALGLFPGVAEAQYAEWWAHCRPHGSGHQVWIGVDEE